MDDASGFRWYSVAAEECARGAGAFEAGLRAVVDVLQLGNACGDWRQAMPGHWFVICDAWVVTSRERESRMSDDSFLKHPLSQRRRFV